MKKIRKPKDIFDDLICGHTFLESFETLAGSTVFEVNLQTRDIKEIKRTIKWLTKAIAYLEQEKRWSR